MVIKFHGPKNVINFVCYFGSFDMSLTYARLATDRPALSSLKTWRTLYGKGLTVCCKTSIATMLSNVCSLYSLQTQNKTEKTSRKSTKYRQKTSKETTEINQPTRVHKNHLAFKFILQCLFICVCNLERFLSLAVRNKIKTYLTTACSCITSALPQKNNIVEYLVMLHAQNWRNSYLYKTVV